MRTTASLLLVVGLSLSACNSEPEPADVPTPTDSLTTDTESETGPETTSPTSDEMSTTSEPATNSPPDDETTTTSPPDDEATTSQAAGIPELPDEATEDSEAGAEAFALHYIDLLNATGIEPQTGVLEPLAADSCDTCANYEGNIQHLQDNNLRNSGTAVIVRAASATLVGEGAVVFLEADQLAHDVIASDDTVARSYEEIQGATFQLDLGRGDGGWIVNKIAVQE